MHYSHTRWIVKIVILLLFITILPFQSSELYAQRSSSSKSTTKKKSRDNSLLRSKNQSRNESFDSKVKIL